MLNCSILQIMLIIRGSKETLDRFPFKYILRFEVVTQ